MPQIQVMVKIISDTNQVVPGSVRVKSFSLTGNEDSFIEGMVNYLFEAISNLMDTVYGVFTHTRLAKVQGKKDARSS